MKSELEALGVLVEASKVNMATAIDIISLSEVDAELKDLAVEFLKKVMRSAIEGADQAKDLFK